jgi:hypothetical protein
MDPGEPIKREWAAALADRTLTKAGENADAKVKVEHKDREKADQGLLEKITENEELLLFLIIGGLLGALLAVIIGWWLAGLAVALL